MIGPHSHMRYMENFDYSEPADVFVGGDQMNKKYRIAYHRFETGAEAVRFAVELQSSTKLVATVLETDDGRFVAEEIRNLYHSEDYPLPRRLAS